MKRIILIVPLLIFPLICFAQDENNCKKLENEVNALIEEVKYCQSDDECMLDESFVSMCPFGCYLIRSKLFDDGEYLALIKKKMKQYDNNILCPQCDYQCLEPPKPQDIKCRKNKCVDTGLPEKEQSPASK